MFAESRDIIALVFLEKRLGMLRELFMEKTLAGIDPGEDYWESGEKAIKDELQRRFYGPEVAAFMKKCTTPTKDENSDGAHSQQLSEQAVLMSHRILAGIAFVGQSGFEDGDS